MSKSIEKTKENIFNKYYYSLSEGERHEAIKKLAAENTSDASRELIQIFYNSQWRETKFFVISNISECENQRSLEFLIEISSYKDDIPIVELAIKSLAKFNNKLAQKYLVQLYKNGKEYLKPAIVSALTQVYDRSLVNEYLNDLEAAFKSEQHYLLKSLIFALGELKCQNAIKPLQKIIEQTNLKELALSAIMALGKISRELEDIAKFENKFSIDPFERQIYLNVKNQIILRSGWKAEDYLQKIFEVRSYHPAMPFELSTFSEADVKAGLDLFSSADNQIQLLDVLSKIEFNNLENWYQEYINKFKITDFEQISASLSRHYSDRYLNLVQDRKDLKNENWLKLLISCLPSADRFFCDIFKSDEYQNLEAQFKINIINQYVNCIAVCKSDERKIKDFEKQIDQLLVEESSVNVQTRLLRALAQFSVSTSKANAFVKKNIQNKDCISSCLYYLKKAPSVFAHEMIEQLIKDKVVDEYSENSLIKTISAQTFQVFTHKVIENYLIGFGDAKKNRELQVSLLQLLSRHPLVTLKSFVVESLSSSDYEIQLNSVIAIKAYQDEKTTELVFPLLSSSFKSVSGRALDTLLALPGLRSKRLVFDYFIQNINSPEVVESVCRRFELTDIATDYFYNNLSAIINKNEKHPQLFILNELKEKFYIDIEATKLSQIEKKDTEVLALDLELSNKISIYNQYDESSKSALRSAELPFVHPEMYGAYIDKSASILGYSKALDIILEKQLGRKFLFPKLEKRLHEFQNAVHLFELNDYNPSFDRVIKNLNLEKHFNQQSLPFHKMSLVAQGILNAKIINEHFKILDGLRAWAVILLLFSRKTNLTPKPLLQLTEDENIIINFCKKLMWLQDLRNPVAHRQTLSDFKAVEQARAEVVDILNSLNKLLNT